MRTVHLFIVLGLSFGLNTSCSSKPEKATSTSVVSDDQEVEVFYFHNTRRCATCQAVETVSGEAIAELFGERVSQRKTIITIVDSMDEILKFNTWILPTLVINNQVVARGYAPSVKEIIEFFDSIDQVEE